MSTKVQYRRGTQAQNDGFIGGLAEITVDTTNMTLRVHDGVTPGGRATLSSYTPTVIGLRETSSVISDSNIDLSAGNYFTKTITATTNFTVSNVAAAPQVSSFVLVLTNGGSQTVNWFSGTTWPNGSPPTLTASGVDVLRFFTLDGGTTWRGFVWGLDMGV